MGVRINPTAQFQPATHVRRFKMLNALDLVRIHSYCVNAHQTLRIEVSTSGLNSRANFESEIYCIRTRGSDLQCLLSLEQLKYGGCKLSGRTSVLQGQ